MNTARKFRCILAVAMVLLFLVSFVGLLLFNHECSELHCPVCQALSIGRNVCLALLVSGYLSLGLLFAVLIRDISAIAPPLLTPVRQKVKITS